MQLRRRIKKLVRGSMPFLRGRFTYCGHTIYFPLRSHIFERACDEDIYEREITSLIVALVEPGTTYIDVGANIGLLSAPVLAFKPGARVISIEASPVTLPYLLKTQSDAPRRNEWIIVGAAVGSEPGEAEFWTAGAAQGAFDGLRDTGRGGAKWAVRVAVRTIDEIWHSNDRPPVSVIKMDIEGGELRALQGARECIGSTKPILIIEWSRKNLPAYGIQPNELLDLCNQLGYAAYAAPSLARIDTLTVLQVAMAQTDTFILLPHEK